jgi:hypothetical protein
MGVDAESQSVLRRPGYLFLTFPGEVEAFTWVPRPAPLGIADGVSDVVTTTSRSPLTVLPIDDVGPRFHVWRTLHEMSLRCSGSRSATTPRPKPRPWLAGGGTPSNGRDAEPVERVPERR